MPDSPKLCTSCGQPLAAGRRLSICPACLTKGWQRSKSDEPAAEKTATFEIPGYEITGELARGGMGIVYRARQRSPQREVAVKMLMPQVSLDDMRERFRIEAKVMADLVHPGIMPIYQYGEHTGVPWISMALCGKGSLAARKSEYAGQWRLIAELMLSLSEAVAFAHARGVLHRDLKPGNVLFDDAGRAFLSDFGLAKIIAERSDLTRTISLVGTPHYLAPELINNASQATTASDVYALGAILYELLAGKPPFDGENVAAILKQISEDDPQPLANDVPRDLATIALKCMSKSPAQRYATAQALADDLKRWLANEPITARRMSATERLALWCKRKPALAAMSALLLLAVVGASAVIFAKNRNLKAALDESRETLRASLLTQIRHTRISARMQDRDAALEAVRRAAAIYTTPELEEEAASLLAMTSMQEMHVLNGIPNRRVYIPDEQLQRAANFTNKEDVVIEELPSRQVVAHLGKVYAQSSRHPFSPDGQLIVVLEGPNNCTTVKEWHTGRVVLRSQDGGIRQSPCFSPDGTRLACGDMNGKLELYDLTQPGLPPVEWTQNVPKPAFPREFSPDGRWLAVGSDKHQVWVFDAATGALKCTRGLEEDGTVQSIEWFPDSTGLLIGGIRGHVRGWSIHTANHAGRLLPRHNAQVYGMAVHPHGQIAITCAYDTQNLFIDWPSGRVIGMDATLSNIAHFSTDGHRACLYNEDARTLRLFDVRPPAACRQFAAPEQLADLAISKGSWDAQMSPDGRLFLAMELGSTNVFDRVSARHLGRIPVSAGSGMAWLKGGRELWLCTRRKELKRYGLNIDDNQVLHVQLISSTPLKGAYLYRMGVSETGDRWIVSAGDSICTGSISSTEFESLPLPPNITTSNNLNFACLSADGRWIAASADKTGDAALYDFQQRAWVKQFKTGISPVFWFAPDHETLWLSSKDALTRIDLRTLTEVRTLVDRKEPGMVGLFDGSADGSLIASADGQSVCLREGRSGEPFLWLRHPLPLATAWVDLTPDGRWLTYSGLGHVQQVWDLAKLEVEMKKLGLPWRGPHIEMQPDAPPLTKLVVE